MNVTAVVPAAGIGSRIARKKGPRKPFLIVKGRPILVHTLNALENSKYINDIIVVVHNKDVGQWRSITSRYRLKKIRNIIAGGKTRHESVKKGLSFIHGSCDMVLIHDGVRPLISGRIIRDTIKACKRYGAAVAGMPVTSTVKTVTKALRVESTPNRKRLYIAQTPQVFKKDIILRAYKRYAMGRGATDDSMLVERLKIKVKMVPGSYDNIKITTPKDLLLAESILMGRR